MTPDQFSSLTKAIKPGPLLLPADSAEEMWRTAYTTAMRRYGLPEGAIRAINVLAAAELEGS
ncbi:hypothetical protein ACRB68_14890 [Actinomadura sp. RB68]|uniref:Uncharacterized protein n=2 Tax=Actinomadura macrotermitis TaxID=2585200 RepID=A0A7K0BQP0_9ACTN|nr:hypothetical protein [Actinomadura macrotermitis]